MHTSPILVFHIAGGTSGLLSGAAAMVFRKGSHRHRVAGNVFVVSMLVLAASGAYMGFMQNQILNGMMGILTFYLVTTAWWTARHRNGAVGLFDFGALLAPLAVGATLLIYAFRAAHSPTKGGDPAAACFIFGSLALLFAVGDIRMLARGVISGTQRITRHLLRMCFALFIAAGSLFLARPHLFPAFMRKSGILFLLSILPLILMIYWRFRVRSRTAYQEKPMVHRVDAYSARAQGDLAARAIDDCIKCPMENGIMRPASRA